MAKIVEDVLVIKFSKIVKDSAGEPELISDEVISALEEVAQGMCDNSVIVEVVKA